jgi:hypothetical protein
VTVLAVDPGITGALAWADGAGGQVAVEDMPTITVRGKHKVNAAVLAQLFQSHGSPSCVLIEQVSAMPSVPGPTVGAVAWVSHLLSILALVAVFSKAFALLLATRSS